MFTKKYEIKICAAIVILTVANYTKRWRKLDGGSVVYGIAAQDPNETSLQIGTNLRVASMATLL